MYFQHHSSTKVSLWYFCSRRPHVCSINQMATGVHDAVMICYSQMYENMQSLQVGCGSAQYNYLITHNVSLDQSPITVNRTNVTLYGVQPGETYTVEITPYVTNCFSAKSNLATAKVNIKSPAVCIVIGQRGKPKNL